MESNKITNIDDYRACIYSSNFDSSSLSLLPVGLAYERRELKRMKAGTLRLSAPGISYDFDPGDPKLSFLASLVRFLGDVLEKSAVFFHIFELTLLLTSLFFVGSTQSRVRVFSPECVA